jgi:ribosomal protein L3 glutamine methyltransferase
MKIEKLNTIRDFINFAVKQFKKSRIYFGHGTDNALDEAIYLILHVLELHQNTMQYINNAILNTVLTAKQKNAVLKIIRRRVEERIPAPYLTHEAWFCGLPFYVDKRVLIPRSPLAELIQNYFAPWINSKKIKRILDIGTGSGCIAIACAHAFPKIPVDAVDISSGALKVAAINCASYKLTKQVHLIKSNLFAALKNKKYDIIISNPPYVSKNEMEILPKEYAHEPNIALLAAKNGIEIITRILQEAAKYLAPKGILIVEAGNSAPIIIEKYPHLPFTWLEFEHGESEVFLLTKEQLKNINA